MPLNQLDIVECPSTYYLKLLADELDERAKDSRKITPDDMQEIARKLRCVIESLEIMKWED